MSEDWNYLSTGSYHAPVTLTTIKPNNCFSFSNAEGKTVGTLDFSGEKMKFVGDADESAKIFFDAVINMMERKR